VVTFVSSPFQTVYLAFASDGNVPELVKGVEWLAEARELETWRKRWDDKAINKYCR
jgi:hypothetical protein